LGFIKKFSIESAQIIQGIFDYVTGKDLNYANPVLISL